MLKRGQKQCPKCSTVTAARSSSCKNCNHVFYTTKGTTLVIKNPGVGKGKKKCDNCGGIIAARSLTCKHCNDTSVGIKVTERAGIPDNTPSLDDLSIGEYIKIVNGSGPYYLDKVSNEKVCMGHSGVFQIKEKKEGGLLVYGATRKNGGFCFLDISNNKYNPATGIYTQPYRFKKVIKKERVR
jgi:RNA polymerase subunit RPABC4/transcription elongation factor Spt4